MWFLPLNLFVLSPGFFLFWSPDCFFCSLRSNQLVRVIDLRFDWHTCMISRVHRRPLQAFCPFFVLPLPHEAQCFTSEKNQLPLGCGTGPASPQPCKSSRERVCAPANKQDKARVHTVVSDLLWLVKVCAPSREIEVIVNGFWNERQQKGQTMRCASHLATRPLGGVFIRHLH